MMIRPTPKVTAIRMEWTRRKRNPRSVTINAEDVVSNINIHSSHVDRNDWAQVELSKSKNRFIRAVAVNVIYCLIVLTLTNCTKADDNETASIGFVGQFDASRSSNQSRDTKENKELSVKSRQNALSMPTFTSSEKETPGGEIKHQPGDLLNTDANLKYFAENDLEDFMPYLKVNPKEMNSKKTFYKCQNCLLILDGVLLTSPFFAQTENGGSYINGYPVDTDKVNDALSDYLDNHKYIIQQMEDDTARWTLQNQTDPIFQKRIFCERKYRDILELASKEYYIKERCHNLDFNTTELLNEIRHDARAKNLAGADGLQITFTKSHSGKFCMYYLQVDDGECETERYLNTVDLPDEVQAAKSDPSIQVPQYTSASAKGETTAQRIFELLGDGDYVHFTRGGSGSSSGHHKSYVSDINCLKNVACKNNVLLSNKINMMENQCSFMASASIAASVLENSQSFVHCKQWQENGQ